MPSLFSKLYDSYLQRSDQGELYHVSIDIEREGGVTETKTLEVWARDEAQAQERAMAMAQAMEAEAVEGIEDKSLGLVLPKKHYQSKGVMRSITAPFAVWRDPVYKKSVGGVFNGVGYRCGSITKSSIDALKNQVTSNAEANVEITPAYLNRVLKVNIVSMFLWAGLLVMSFVFFLLAIDPANAERFHFPLLNPFIIASFFCFAIGATAEYKAVRDYRWIMGKLREFDRKQPKIEGGNTEEHPHG